MGCFSYLSVISGKPANSNSFNGSPCHLFLLKDGKVIEHMYGNYDSYGRVFTKGSTGSFEWKMDWGEVVDLCFNNNPKDGIAMILEDEYEQGYIPDICSQSDPDQGWGKNWEYLGDVGEWKQVEEPFHKVY